MPLYNVMKGGASAVSVDSASTPEMSMGGGDPIPKNAKTAPTERRDSKGNKISDDDYYKINAKLMYYRDILRDKLKEKDPEGFDKFTKDIGKVNITQGFDAGKKAIEEHPYDKYLTAEEVKSSLGKDYEDYIGTLNRLKDIGFVDTPSKNFAGVLEGQADLGQLNFGKRFAMTTVLNGQSSENDGEVTRTDYVYNKDKKDVDVITTKRKKSQF